MNKFSEKYLKYKSKYLNLKKHFGGSDKEENQNSDDESDVEDNTCLAGSSACVCKKCTSGHYENIPDRYKCRENCKCHICEIKKNLQPQPHDAICECHKCKAELLAYELKDSPHLSLESIIMAKKSKFEKNGFRFFFNFVTNGRTRGYDNFITSK